MPTSSNQEFFESNDDMPDIGQYGFVASPDDFPMVRLGSQYPSGSEKLFPLNPETAESWKDYFASPLSFSEFSEMGLSAQQEREAIGRSHQWALACSYGLIFGEVRSLIFCTT